MPLWQEPILRHPVLIIESDDWAPGPPQHGEQLSRLLKILSSCRDHKGHPAVMTLGVVLSVPDSKGIKKTNLSQYLRLTLADPQFKMLLDVMKQGSIDGVFGLQLHGLDHFWPPSVMKAATRNITIRQWLTKSRFPLTENLPSELQSRWIDASVLPSRSIPAAETRTAAIEEVACFASIFGHTPFAAVPPTFLWNSTVENAWREAGVQVVVTPGWRYESRDANGTLRKSKTRIRNGQKSPSGLMYLVREEYFEPLLGHQAEKGLEALARKTKMRRPTLLETHRFNFVNGGPADNHGIRGLERLLKLALRTYPDILFMSSETLAKKINEKDPDLIEAQMRVKVMVWLRRVYEERHISRLGWLTGFIIPASALIFMGNFFEKRFRNP